MTIVDANIVVKWFVPEPDSADANHVREIGGLLVAPEHALGEVGEVLVRRYRGGVIARRQLELAIDEVLTSLLFVPPSELFDASLAISLEGGVSFYDALYVAAAAQRGDTLVSADERLTGKISGTRWAEHVMSLTEWVAQNRKLQ